MSLNEYKKKRNLKETSEPKAEKKSSSGKLKFVIQRHQASHLHYDFRLETDGVLKSWAVPKGPSMNPSEKRLAILVEDHPLDYAKFEGEIPEGNYGAGTVEIWDNGTWEPDEKFKDVSKALKKGLIEFTLKGKNLKGEFILVEMENSTAENGWLLIKKEDRYSVEDEYDANDIKPVSKK